MNKIVLSLVALLLTHFSYTQVVRCFSDEMEIELRNNHPELPSRDEFDQW